MQEHQLLKRIELQEQGGGSVTDPDGEVVD